MNKTIKKLIIAAIILLYIIGTVALSRISFYVDVNQAKKYYENGDYAKAVSLYTDLIERNTNDKSELYILCADSYLSAGDYDSALKILNSAFGNVNDENIINEKINNIKSNTSTSSKTLKPAKDYKTSSDSFVLILFSYIIIISTVGYFSILFIYDKHKQHQKALNTVLFSDITKSNIKTSSNDKLPAKRVIKLNHENYDPMIEDVIATILENKNASTSLLQQKLKLNYARAAQCLNILEKLGIVGPYEGSKPRKILVDTDFLNNTTFDYPNPPHDKHKLSNFNNMNEYDFELFIASCNHYVENKDNKQKLENSNPEQLKSISIVNTTNHIEDTVNATAKEKALTLKDILSIIDKMSENGWEFEKFIAKLLLKNGFSSANVTSGSNDYGVDIIAKNSLGVRYAIQCKCYSSKLNNKPVQEIVAGKSIYNCQVGVVVTNNFFTDNAIKVAEANNILLWNRNKLCEFISNVIDDISTILRE